MYLLFNYPILRKLSNLLELLENFIENKLTEQVIIFYKMSNRCQFQKLHFSNSRIIESLEFRNKFSDSTLIDVPVSK